MNQSTEYIIHTSSTDKLFDIITLIIYDAGNIKNVKKYSQNHFFISFSASVSS
jgi:hypothetical protein